MHTIPEAEIVQASHPVPHEEHVKVEVIPYPTLQKSHLPAPLVLHEAVSKQLLPQA